MVVGASCCPLPSMPLGCTDVVIEDAGSGNGDAVDKVLGRGSSLGTFVSTGRGVPGSDSAV